jgi:hypothetical protein
MGIQFLVLFLVPLALQGSTVHEPPYFRNRMHYFLEARCFPPFAEGFWCKRLLGEHKSYLSYSQKSSNWHFSRDISPAKLRSTARVWNPQGISKLVNKVDCRVPCASLKAIVWAFLATKSFAAGSSTYPCHMACVSKSVLRDVISLSDCRPQWLRSAVDETRDSWSWLLSVLFSGYSGFSGT